MTEKPEEITAFLPQEARLPINRCNLPAVVLGGLHFQEHPCVLEIDGIKEFHAQLFTSLNSMESPAKRAIAFQDYMRACFLLDNLDDAGLNLSPGRINRGRADYLRLLRGWMFDSDSIEAAVMKGWVESRFGLTPRYHNGPITSGDDDNYRSYQAARARGLYNTNALEAQIDLLYSYCQYELGIKDGVTDHLTLYRGSNNMDRYQGLIASQGRRHVVLLNNLNSFTADSTQADSFGDTVMAARIPLAKLLYFPGLLPGVLQGEGEHLVIGGIYRVSEVAAV